MAFTEKLKDHPHRMMLPLTCFTLSMVCSGRFIRSRLFIFTVSETEQVREKKHKDEKLLSIVKHKSGIVVK